MSIIKSEVEQISANRTGFGWAVRIDCIHDDDSRAFDVFEGSGLINVTRPVWGVTGHCTWEACWTYRSPAEISSEAQAIAAVQDAIEADLWDPIGDDQGSDPDAQWHLSGTYDAEG